MSKPAYARIAISLPKADLAAADRAAKEQDRSRSWIIAEAIRRYTAERAVREPSVSYAVTPGLGPSRQAQLEADIRLTPLERVMAAEETARVSFLLRPSFGKRVLAFDRFEDYLAWKRVEARGG